MILPAFIAAANRVNIFYDKQKIIFEIRIYLGFLTPYNCCIFFGCIPASYLKSNLENVRISRLVNTEWWFPSWNTDIEGQILFQPDKNFQMLLDRILYDLSP